MRADRIKKIARSAIIDLPEPEWRAIEASCGIRNRNDAFRNQLSRRIKLACSPDGPPTFGTVNGPRLTEVKLHIEEVQTAAKKLNRTLLRLTKAASTDQSADYAKHAIVVELSRLASHGFPEFWNNLVTSPASLELAQDIRGNAVFQKLFLTHHLLPTEAFIDSFTAILAEAIKSAAQSLPRNHGGRPRNIILDEIIATLAVTYRETTGKKPFSGTNANGKFFRFCMACLDAFAPQLAKGSRLALSKRIQRILDSNYVQCHFPETKPRSKK
jgi:hypothetical protein